MDRSQFTKTGNDTFDPVDMLENCRIDTAVELIEPPTLLSVGTEKICTLGNFSLLIGKAKSRKTFLGTGLTAAAAAGHCSIDSIKGVLRPANKILYFDTEQSPYHAQRMVRCICKQIGEDKPTNLLAYGLRPLEPGERWKVIQHGIENTPNLALVVIDGIADLLSNGINDEPEAIELASALLRWSQDRNIHIITVLHQNKGDFNARGHIGTYLVNKAETVLSVTKDAKDDSISVVKAEYCRNMDLKPFAFTIGDDGLPCIADQMEGTQSRKTTQIAENFNHIFSDTKSFPYTELTTEYMEASGLGIASAKNHISQAAKSGIIIKTGGVYTMTTNNDNDVPF